MAETVGLVLSGIALTSMLTTCVDILEYSSNARYWIHDLNLVVTKVGLLQHRLTRLREISAHEAARTSSDSESDSFSDNKEISLTGQICNATTRGLSGVTTVLEQTNKLCRRYSLAPIHEAGGPITSESNAQPSKSGLEAYVHLPDARAKRANGLALKRWHRLSRRICWTLQDKKRFDRLILDLDFLLSNTERLVEWSQSRFFQTQYCQHTEKSNTSAPTHVCLQSADGARVATDIGMSSAKRSAKTTSRPVTSKDHHSGNHRSAKSDSYWQSAEESPRTRATKALVVYEQPSSDTESSQETMRDQQVSGAAAQDDFKDNMMDDSSLLLAGAADAAASSGSMRVVGTSLTNGSILSIRASNAAHVPDLLKHMRDRQNMKLEELRLRQQGPS